MTTDEKHPDTLRSIPTWHSQADAILSAIEDHLPAGETLVIGRTATSWFARQGDTTHQGVTARDALAQLAQVLVCS
jgi:hypothetical protein